MKKNRKNAIAFFIAVMMLFTSVTWGTISTAALSPDYTGDPSTVYFLFDYYPSMGNTQATIEYPDHQFVYDHRDLNPTALLNMLAVGYFEGLEDACVILDIKNSSLDASILAEVFETLKDQNCQTILITPQALSEFTNTSFMTYVDEYYHTTYGRLRSFIRNIFLHQEYLNGTIAGTTVLIDGYLLDADSVTGQNVDNLCAQSVFLKFFLEYFAEEFEMEDDITYSQIAVELRNEMGINLLVHTSTNQFVNIFTGNIYTASNINQLYHTTDNPWQYICAIGFSHFDSNFRSFLKSEQARVGAAVLPVYTFEADPIVYGGTLTIETDYALGNIYTLPWNEPEELKEIFLSLGILETVE